MAGAEVEENGTERRSRRSREKVAGGQHIGWRSISTISTQSKQLAVFVRQSCHTHTGDTYSNSIPMPLSLAVSVQRRTRHAIQDVAPLEKNLLHQSRTAIQKSLGDLGDAPTTDLALELLCPHLRPWLV